MAAQEHTRIAPTPSGLLHAGNAVAFLLTAELALRQKAVLRLRIDDLDTERMRPEYLDEIFDALHDLDIEWQEGPKKRLEHQRSWSQHLRLGRYQGLLDLLKEQGDLYACACTRTELKHRPCGCRSKQLPFDAPESAWRLRIPEDAWVRMRGLHGEPQRLRVAERMSDPVLRQRPSLGGRPAYQIASLADDTDHGTTLIVRGMDLLPSTACQLYLAERLGLAGFQQVRFVHHPLVTDAQGRKLSKSDGADSLKARRARGESAEGLRTMACSMLDQLGNGDQSTP
jgi:glutamyl-tRNA synthetase